MDTTDPVTQSQGNAPVADDRPFDWFRTMSGKGRRAFVGAFGGYGLDSYDFQVLPLALGGALAPRGDRHALLGIDAAAKQALSLATTGKVYTLDGSAVHVPSQSICVHGDSPDAVDIARSVRACLEANGVAVEAFT